MKQQYIFLKALPVFCIAGVFHVNAQGKNQGAAKIKKALNDKYLNRDTGIYGSGVQTVNGLMVL